MRILFGLLDSFCKNENGLSELKQWIVTNSMHIPGKCALQAANLYRKKWKTHSPPHPKKIFLLKRHRISTKNINVIKYYIQMDVFSYAYNTLIFSHLSSTSCNQDKKSRPLYRDLTFLSLSSCRKNTHTININLSNNYIYYYNSKGNIIFVSIISKHLMTKFYYLRKLLIFYF